MSTCYVIAREGVSGGTGTLSYRILNYFNKRGLHCAYLCCENNAPDNLELIKSVVDYVEIADDLSYRTQFERIRDKFQNFTFLTYSIKEFLAIDKLRKKHHSISKSLYYVVHGYAFSVPKEIKISKFKRRLMKLYVRFKNRRLVKGLIRNNSILFMDILSLQETEECLNIRIDKSLIHFLPMEMKPYPENYWLKLSRHSPFVIGTMCRMEFPFKGYVFGLIDAFTCLCEKYDVGLRIVGDGPNADLLKMKLEEIPLSIRERIEYQKNVDYSKLDSFYRQCDLVLGMGTMLLDAANYNVLAIPVAGYTFELNVSSLFADNVEWLFSAGVERNFQDLFRELFSLSQNEYNELIEKQYKKVRLYYGIESFAYLLTDAPIGINKLKISDRIDYDILKK